MEDVEFLAYVYVSENIKYNVDVVNESILDKVVMEVDRAILKIILTSLIPPFTLMTKIGPNYQMKLDLVSWKTPFKPIFLPIRSDVSPVMSITEIITITDWFTKLSLGFRIKPNKKLYWQKKYQVPY